jgi:hypothetical protein
MAQKQRLFSSNEFIILLTLFLGLIAVTIVLLNISQKQNFKSKAYQPASCNTSVDCPSGTVCRGGKCVLTPTSSISQAPLAYVDISSIVEKPKPIPAIYVTPTPLPKVNFLISLSQGINGTIGGFLAFIGNFLESVASEVAQIWTSNHIDRNQ